MNFSYGVITAVGVLIAISLGLIAADPSDVIEPREIRAEKLTICTMEYVPVCGVDGQTYANMCTLNASDIALSHKGECGVDDPIVKPRTMPEDIAEPVEEISVNSYILPKTATVGDVLLIEVEFRDDGRKIVDHVNYDIIATQDGDTILSEPGSHRHPGMHPIHETSVLNESPIEIQVTLQGLGHGDEISEPKGDVTTATVNPEVGPVALTNNGEVTIGTAEESGFSQDCAPDNCYIPGTATVNVGGTVIMTNTDTTGVHTFTSGTVDGFTPSPDGVFDSDILMSGDSFEWVPDTTGDYPYYCMLHTWMVGTIIVQEAETVEAMEEETMEEETMEEEIMEEVVETPEPVEDTSESMALTISIPKGTGAPGCETTLECYLPYEVTVKAGTTITWINEDTTVHTVTSGIITKGTTGLFDSSIFTSGNSFEFTFNNPGTYDYFCNVHPWMAGIVHVN